MLEFLGIACLAVALGQTSCMHEIGAAPGPRNALLDSYEMRVAPGMYQLSYAASGHDYGVADLTRHWHARAAQLCAGAFFGQPLSQAHYPEPGFDAMTSSLALAAVRTFNVEVYGAARCADASR